MNKSEETNGGGQIWGVDIKAIERLGSLGLLGLILVGVYFIADRHLSHQSQVWDQLKVEMRDQNDLTREFLQLEKETLSARRELTMTLDKQNLTEAGYAKMLQESLADLRLRIRRLEQKAGILHEGEQAR